MTLAASSTAQNFWRYVQEQGYFGSINDQLSKLLTAEGYSGPTPSSLYSLLGSLGYTGTLNERINSFEREYTIRYGNTAAWSPLALFAAAEAGVWYDPSDLSTMFQDVAGTTPVTAIGDPVGKILDKSGNGKHASQATAASRPILRHDGTNYYLEFDGVDDSLATAAIDFSATQLLSFFAGIRKIGSSAASGVLTELTASSANLGSFSIFAPNSGTESYLFIANGGAGTGYIATTYTAPITNVIACNYNLAANSNELKVIPRINGATPGTLTVAGGVPAGGAQTFANAAMYIGRRGGTTLPLNGRIYSLIVLGRTATALEIAAAESYAAGKSGVVLP